MPLLARATCAKLWPRPVRACTARLPSPPGRSISINSAIHRGIREDTTIRSVPSLPSDPSVRFRRRRFGDDGEPIRGKPHSDRNKRRTPTQLGLEVTANSESRKAWLERNPRFVNGPDPDPYVKYKKKETETRYPFDKPAKDDSTAEDREVDDYTYNSEYDNGPLPVPYTTAASQFIYGFSAVLSALRAQRRQFYKIYIHSRALQREDSQDKALQRALSGLPHGSLDVVHVENNHLRMLDQISGGKPHNGVVLEAAPLPTPKAEGLGIVRGQTNLHFEVLLPSKRGRDQHRLPYNSHGWRYPFVLYLDGIKDTGNMGAIIRSAYYLGVDAIFLSERATATVNATANKASAGAAEVIPIYIVPNGHSFLSASKRRGWSVYAATAPPPPEDNFNVASTFNRMALDPSNTSPMFQIRRASDPTETIVSTPLAQNPTILMMGSEGEGLVPSIERLADYLVGVRGVKGDLVGIDSLNVSVAAALLCLEFVRKPATITGERPLKVEDQPRRSEDRGEYLF